MSYNLPKTALAYIRHGRYRSQTMKQKTQGRKLSALVPASFVFSDYDEYAVISYSFTLRFSSWGNNIPSTINIRLNRGQKRLRCRFAAGVQGCQHSLCPIKAVVPAGGLRRDTLVRRSLPAPLHKALRRIRQLVHRLDEDMLRRQDGQHRQDCRNKQQDSDNMGQKIPFGLYRRIHGQHHRHISVASPGFVPDRGHGIQPLCFAVLPAHRCNILTCQQLAFSSLKPSYV